MKLDLQTRVEHEFKKIIQKAIESNKIDTQSMRMIVVSLDNSFQNLNIYTTNDWDCYFDTEYAPLIGTINISEWLDIADEALKNKDSLSDSYVELAKTYAQKYLETAPAINFDHLITLDPKYHSYLVCLREELIFQIEAAIRVVATSYSQEDFKHVVGFFTHNLTFKLTRSVLLQAFNHEKGTGPFYKVRLTLPDTIRSEHYLQFHTNGFQLYSTNGTLLEDTKKESEVYNYDIADFAFIYIENKELVFRIEDEFQNWIIESKNVQENKGDRTEKEFISAFQQLLNHFPEKVFISKNIPNPLTDQLAFKNWFDKILDNNITIKYAHHQIIFNYGEAAFRHFLELIPKTDPKFKTAQHFLARKLFYNEQFQESLELYGNPLLLSINEKIECLCSLFILNEKEKFNALKKGIETKSAQITLELLDTLWLLRDPINIDALKDLEQMLIPLLETYKGEKNLYLLAVVLTKLYILQNKKDKAQIQLQSVPTHETFERVLLRSELQQVDYIMHAYDVLLKKAEQKNIIEKHLENHSLKTTNKKKTEIVKTEYEHCYFLINKIQVNEYLWVYPLSAETFIAVCKKNGYNLVLVKIISEQTVKTIQKIALPKTRKFRSGTYFEGLLYMTDAIHGVVTYTISESYIAENDIVYKNKKSKAAYENSTITDGYVFASNNNYLEIFERNKPETNVLSDSLYIRNGYDFFINNNLLVVVAGSVLLLLVDITDKSNPTFLSSIQEDMALPIHIAFVGDYMISESIYNISNPSTPEWISRVNADLKLTYFFTPQPEEPIFSTDQDFLFTTLTVKNNQPIYTNWLESLNKEFNTYESASYNLVTAFFDDTVITYSREEISIWKKGLRPKSEKIDVHALIDAMVKNCFQYILEVHPTFEIGKVILQSNSIYQHIDIAFHHSSSLAILTDSTEKQELPIISSTFLFENFTNEILHREYYNTKIQYTFDGDLIINALIQDSRFEGVAAQYVVSISDTNTNYLHFPIRPWNPFRYNSVEEDQEEDNSISAIILRRNENQIIQLIDDIDNDTDLLDELLDITNKKLYRSAEVLESTKTDAPSEKSAEIISAFQELIDNTIDLSHDDNYNKDENEYEVEGIIPETTYIVWPYLSPVSEEEDKNIEDLCILDGFVLSTKDTLELKKVSFDILCSLSNSELVKEIIFNGMQYGYLHYNKNEIPIHYRIDQQLISRFINNDYELWDDFGNDTDIRLFLMSNIEQLDSAELKVKVAYICGHVNHPLIQEHLRNCIHEGLSYFVYKGEFTEIDISTLPIEVIKSAESLLLEKATLFEQTTDDILKIDAKEQLVYIYDLLQKIGHERTHAIVTKILKKAVEQQEKYGSLDDDDDEYESESAFLVTLYRKAKVTRLLRYYSSNSGALWPLEEPLELYAESWNKTIEALFKEGSMQLGETFSANYTEQLVVHIPLDDSYKHDRTLALELIQHAYKHILKKPARASLIEPLILAIIANKELFDTQIEIAALKDKYKHLLLQAAWNDLTNKEWDLAEQKADAVLVLDPAMGQVYFLKARLLWLREGIPAYLEQQEYFIEKAFHELPALARLYNLSGCALDVEKRYEEALDYFKKAALTAPQEPMYVANVVEMYYKLGKPKEALKHAKVAKLNGNSGEILTEIIQNKGIHISL